MIPWEAKRVSGQFSVDNFRGIELSGDPEYNIWPHLEALASRPLSRPEVKFVNKHPFGKLPYVMVYHPLGSYQYQCHPDFVAPVSFLLHLQDFVYSSGKKLSGERRFECHEIERRWDIDCKITTWLVRDDAMKEHYMGVLKKALNEFSDWYDKYFTDAQYGNLYDVLVPNKPY